MSQERNGYHFEEPCHKRHKDSSTDAAHEEQSEYDEESFLTDELDHEILMHRDAHFGGSFDVMLDYYQDEKVGVNPDFERERIEYLAAIEKEMGQNLAALMLTASEAEAVGNARQAYQQFKEIYEKGIGRFPKLLADLILSEEEEPEDEIQAIVDEGNEIVPELIAIIKSEDAYDPLFPGYGYAPYLAMICLGRIHDSRAIVPIFEALSRETIFGEEAAIDALVELGDPAKEFLLKMIASRPVTRDNATAAYALTALPWDETIGLACLKQLQDPDVRKHYLLANYLLASVELLQQEGRDELIALSNENLPKDLKVEIDRIIRSWER